MAFKWSNEQQEAISAKGINTLVSAGAGSGKTAVLTERIYRLIKDGARIDRFLVLTFTNAAAAEMKTRVRQKLLADPALSHLAVAIENSHVETFDSFNLFLVKKYAFELGVSSNLAILDGGIIKIKTIKIINEIFEEEYKKKSPVFASMIENYCIKDDDNLVNLIWSIIDMADKQIDRDEFLDNFIAKYYDENRLKTILEETLNNYKEKISKILKLANDLEDSDDADAIFDALTPLLNSSSYNEFYDLCKKTDFPKKNGRVKTSDGAYRDKIKALYDGMRFKNQNDYGTAEEIIDSYMSQKDVAELLLDITRRTLKTLDAYKDDVGSYSFSDVSRMAIKALKIPAIREEMKNYFDFIMVDEYQDTSDTQEVVLNAIERDNLYMVGDVKQSIYAFRNANCNIFLDKYNNYKKGLGGKEIDLNTSYRSRKDVVKLVNDAFGKLMIPENNIIDYSNGHEFKFGFEPYNDMIDNNLVYEPQVYNYSIEKSAEMVELEANIIAQDIENKYKKVKVYRKDEGFVNATYKDFAILIDRKSSFDEYRKIFAERHIPLKVIAPEKVRDSSISLVTKNLLILFNAIKNECYDNNFRHAFASIARSFLIIENDQNLFEIFNENAFEFTDIFRKMKGVVINHRYDSNYDILSAIYKVFDIYNNVLKIGNISSNSHKADLFLSNAKSLDLLGCNLEDFIEYFNDCDEFEVDVEYSDNDTAEDAVTLINFHKSKGLEYPICYFAGLGKEFYRGSVDTSFLVDDKYGLILPFTGNTERANIFIGLMKNYKNIADLQEKLRLLYVAITRARECAIFLMPQNVNGKRVENFSDCKCNADILKCINFDNEYSDELPIKPEYESEYDIRLVKATDVTYKTIDVPATAIGFKNKASKELVEDVNDSLLEFGTKLHFLLEVADYETKDVSYISDSDNTMKKYVSNILNCGLFENVKNEQVLHEYSFVDELNNSNGVIDCMVVRDDEITIIDFKLKNIDDEKYNKQLNTYGKYIESITNKSVTLYLVSAITGEVKEVEKD